MSTATTRKRILDAAEWVFAENGYAGSSVRSITSMAGTDLGAVRYHFGSKEGLFGAVLRRRLEPLCDERLRLLAVVTQDRGSAPLEVERIIEAFLLPGIRLVTHEGYGRSWMKLMGHVRTGGKHLDSVQAIYTDLLTAFLAAFKAALPELPEEEVSYRMYFMFGTQVNAMINDGTLQALGANLPNVIDDPRGLLDRLVRFVAAGMKAPSPQTRDLPLRVRQRAQPNPFGTPEESRALLENG